MALVRVYCGLASADSARPAPAESQLRAAVVDDAGRLLDVCEVSDDPAGYARLGALLVERSSGSSGVAIAADSDDHLVTSLLTAAGRPLVVVDDDAADDYAERFADDDSPDERQAPQLTKRAIGLARALQAGALWAVTLPTPRDLAAYKPVLAAHTALSNGRNSAAVALREVLRELYPAALRAYPDPARPVPLAVLDAVPGPGQLDDAEQLIAHLSAAGVADSRTVTDAVTALSVAIDETPRRGSANQAITAAVAHAVRQAIAAVRAGDAACDALVSTLSTRVVTPPAGRRAAGRRAAAEAPAVQQPLPPAPTRVGGRRNRPEPANAATATPQPMTSPPVAPAPVAPPPVAPAPVSPPPAAPAPLSPAAGLPSRQAPANRPVSVPPPPPPGITPILPSPRSTGPAADQRPAAANQRGPVPPAETGEPFRPTLTTAAINNARAERRRTVIPPRPNTRAATPEPASSSSGFSATDFSLPMPASRPKADAPEPGSRANWPTRGQNDEPASPPPVEPERPYQGTNGSYEHANGSYEQPADPAPAATRRVTPPWQADDLPAEPPALRLVEPAEQRPGDRLDSPGLRRLDTEEADRTGRAARARRTTTALDRSAPPVSDEGDGDLLIFAATRSAWFTGQSEAEAEAEWSTLADTGWRAAEQAARPAVGAETTAGLPKRVPQANLVPGSPLRDERPLRIVRDAASIAAHTTGYFRGWRRGQEIGGYAIGGRPGREAAGGWDFTRDNGGRDDNREYEYRSAGHRS